jgi:DNA helicase MCM8
MVKGIFLLLFIKFKTSITLAGLLLALFGGRQRYLDATKNVSIRGDSHVLVVGDPGLGKSQMLTAVANTAPRGVYVCSNTSTSSGLTVTLSRESGTGEFTLEAGTCENIDLTFENISENWTFLF